MGERQSVVVRLYGHIGPIDRGRFEDPLYDVLEPADAGSVTGGGTQLNEAGGIDFAEIDVELADLGPALDLLVRTLEEVGAPEGSEVIAGDEVIREFGHEQCLAIFLDGVSLPDDVYQTLDFDALTEELEDVVEARGQSSCWQGPEETALFFYGRNAEDMFARMEPTLRRLPIGQNARVVVGYGKPGAERRTVRLPRHTPGGERNPA